MGVVAAPFSQVSGHLLPFQADELNPSPVDQGLLRMYFKDKAAMVRLRQFGGEAGSPVTVVWLLARGRPPQAAALRAGLESVENSSQASTGSNGGAGRRHAPPLLAPRPTESTWRQVRYSISLV
jgi:hypothetical protein